MISDPRRAADPRPVRRPNGPSVSIEGRVVRAAEAALADRGFVSVIDILVGVGWLAPSHVDAWRQGRLPVLESSMAVKPGRITAAMAAFQRWATQRGLLASEIEYVARTRDRRTLRFSVSGSPAMERAYRTHYVSPDLSERKRQHLADRASRPPDLVVIWPRHDWTCARCGTVSGGLLMMEDGGPVCLECAALANLEFLPRGDAGLTRRAKAASGLSAVVVRWSPSRRRYERQGILVEKPALEAAERR